MSPRNTRSSKRRGLGWMSWLVDAVRPGPRQWRTVKPRAQRDTSAVTGARSERATRAADNRKRENPLLLMFAWLAPMIVALTAFGTPFLGARAYDYLMQTGHFFVREVVVEGHDHLDVAAVLELAGIEAGTHVLATDLEAMSDRLQANEWVARATVARELPDRLIVRIHEHRPAALVAVDGALMLVGNDGAPFAPVSPGMDLEALPILSGLPFDAFADAAAAAVSRADVRAAVNLTRLYDAMGLSNRWPVGEVRLEAGRRMTLVLSRSGTEAVMGTGPYRQKLYRLEWILEKLHQDGKTADYVLLDGAGPSLADRDDGRVVVRADLKPSAEELAQAASERALRAQARALPPMSGVLPGSPASPGEPRPEAGSPSAEGDEPAAEDPEVGDGPGHGVSSGVRPAVGPVWLDGDDEHPGNRDPDSGAGER